MKKENIVLVIGAVLIFLRLIFPVLQCNYLEYYGDIKDYCYAGKVAFFSLYPLENYKLHLERTITQVIAILVLSGVLYLVLRSKKN